MDKLIEILDLILDKSEKFEDGSYLIPKYIVRRIVRASKAYKKGKTFSKTKKEVKEKAEEKEIEPIPFSHTVLPKTN